MFLPKYAKILNKYGFYGHFLPWPLFVGHKMSLFISLIRMRSKRDIKMGRLCTPGDAVLGIVGGGVTFRFLNGEAILDENMLFWVRLYALVVVWKIP